MSRKFILKHKKEINIDNGNMVDENRLEKMHRLASKRLASGKELTNAQRISLEGKLFFSFCWDYYEFQRIVENMEKEGLEPNDALWNLLRESRYVDNGNKVM